jgi:hypothetical protein
MFLIVSGFKKITNGQNAKGTVEKVHASKTKESL